MHPWFEEVRPGIAREIRRLLAQRGRVLARAGRWGGDAARRLAAFARRGKMIRGGLALLACNMYGGGETAEGKRAALRLAACMELLHSGLLVHDDIMDDDRLRRGELSIYAQYEEEALGLGVAAPARFGTAVGICAGDVAFFLALEELASIGCRADRRASLVQLAGRELALVGVGQMQDVILGATRRWPSRSEVLSICTYKTARYSFSLPLMAGALLAGRSSSSLAALERFGELLGTVFQLRDDDLGIYGEERETGKPVGADIREGKKTLLAVELLRRARGSERQELARLFGGRKISKDDVEKVREAAERLGARQAVFDTASRLAKQARRIAASLEGGEPYRTVLKEICEASLRRDR